MLLLSAQQIIAAADMKFVDVNVPEWGGDVRLRVMSGTDRDRFEREWQAADGKMMDAFRQKLLVKCLCDASNKRLFDDAGIEALGAKNATVLSRLFDQCMKLNGFVKDTVEELAKN